MRVPVSYPAAGQFHPARLGRQVPGLPGGSLPIAAPPLGRLVALPPALLGPHLFLCAVEEGAAGLYPTHRLVLTAVRCLSPFSRV